MEYTVMGLMKEYIDRGIVGSGDALQHELLSLIKEYNARTGSYLFVYAAAFSKMQMANVTLVMDDYYVIFDMLKNAQSKKLDFYIETPGGSGETAEEVVGFTRGKFEEVNFIVSGEAKSAGTLIVLSGDNIRLTETGSLGPIDAQVMVGRSSQSAHDYMRWVDEKHAESIKNGALSPFDATMVAQISPGELIGVDNSLQYAHDLVLKWLPEYKFKNWSKTKTNGKTVTASMKQKRAKEIAASLTDHDRWRSHGRSLKMHDLEKIGLQIENIDEDAETANLVYRIQTVIRLLFATTSTYKIFATESEKIFANVIQAGSNVAQPMPQNTDHAAFELECSSCGRKHKLYVKLDSDPEIDKRLQAQNFKPLAADSKHKCECGFEFDVSGICNEIEMQTSRKIIREKI